MVLRIRCEEDSKEFVNSRYEDRNEEGAILKKTYNYSHLDMNATSSRLYRETLTQSAQFIPSLPSASEVSILKKITETLKQLEGLRANEIPSKSFGKLESPKTQRKQLEEYYQLLLQELKIVQSDTLSENPYFNKYNVSGDSKNIVRELRGAVYEDIQDRGVSESKRMMDRNFENRWISR